jgi:hypothetical protein
MFTKDAANDNNIASRQAGWQQCSQLWTRSKELLPSGRNCREIGQWAMHQRIVRSPVAIKGVSVMEDAQGRWFQANADKKSICHLRSQREVVQRCLRTNITITRARHRLFNIHFGLDSVAQPWAYPPVEFLKQLLSLGMPSVDSLGLGYTYILHIDSCFSKPSPTPLG